MMAKRISLGIPGCQKVFARQKEDSFTLDDTSSLRQARMPVLQQHLDQSILHNNFISQKLLRHRKALACAHIELPTVPIAFDYMFAQRALCQRCAFVRTKVFGGIEFAVDVEKSKLAPCWKFYRFAVPVR
jgi:hypothetical protein